jgi:hypothetical protein
MLIICSMLIQRVTALVVLVVLVGEGVGEEKGIGEREEGGREPKKRKGRNKEIEKEGRRKKRCRLEGT